MLKSIFKFIRSLPRKIIKLTVLAFVLLILLLVASAFLSPFHADLEKWHIKIPHGEYHYGLKTSKLDFEAYLELEDRLFATLDKYSVPAGGEKGFSPIIRYVRDGMNNPALLPTNYNRTQVLVPNKIKGGVLLLHGLTDGPYSMRKIAEIFHSHGYYVVSLRIPGHGTVPSGLVDISWKDWKAAVHLAAKHIVEKLQEKPFFVGGYSNGGALALEYTTEQLLDDKTLPDAVFLFSPAVAVTGFARVSNWHKLITWIPYFQRSRWLSVLPEFDPFKYNSFAKNASAQCWALSRRVQNNLSKLHEQQRIDLFPPVITFQSVVDATVLGEAVISRLYKRLKTPDSELVLFDVYRSSGLQRLLLGDPRKYLKELEANPSLPFNLTIVSNELGNKEVNARSKPPFSTEISVTPLGLRWPETFFSLSHLAIPFPPDDPLYGDGSGKNDKFAFTLGDVDLRGERGVLVMGTDLLVRVRHNPFFPVLETKIEEWIKQYNKQDP